MKMRNVLLAGVMALASLSACSSNPHPEGKPLPGLMFDHLEYHPVSVATVDVVNTYGLHKAVGDEASAFVTQPDETLEQYLKARYKPQGGVGRLLFDIQEASLFKFHDDSDVAPARWVGLAGFDEYSLTVKLHVRAENVPGFYELTKDITVHRRVKISEHASIAEREQDQFNAYELMLKDIDDSVTRTLRDEFHILAY